eukprot:1190007-Amphidinium_carterae.1
MGNIQLSSKAHGAASIRCNTSNSKCSYSFHNDSPKETVFVKQYATKWHSAHLEREVAITMCAA